MPIQDRSNEFRSCVQSIRSRSIAPPAKQRLLNKRSGVEPEKGEFSAASTGIRKAISATALKLNKLGQREYASRLSYRPKRRPLVLSLSLSMHHILCFWKSMLMRCLPCSCKTQNAFRRQAGGNLCTLSRFFPSASCFLIVLSASI